MHDVAGRAGHFIRGLGIDLPGEYRFWAAGQISLYASCYAAMALHYLGALDAEMEPKAWCAYINSWQDPETGYYLGPELAPGQATRREMDDDYVRRHLLVHVLPALEVLGGAPAYPLAFARAFAEPAHLEEWLQRRDWSKAWLEGNNLLAIGQFLIHLRDREGYAPAADALDLYFDWLDKQQDPGTGLWGTNGFCDPREALYGAYHQLLIYHACDRPVRHAERIIDTVLPLQQPDGYFSRVPGGGACEDVDAVDMLVNLVKRTGHRLEDVRQALAAVVPHILRQQAPDGGFVYRWGRPYMQSGLLRTFVPIDRPDIFSTWFRLHTLALINEVVEHPALTTVPWAFNASCSMGWHDQLLQVERKPADLGPVETPQRRAGSLQRRLASHGYAAMRRLPVSIVTRLFRATLPRYLRSLRPEKALPTLVELQQSLDRLGREKSYELGGGLHVSHWWSQAYRYYLRQLTGFSLAVHLGCDDGSLSYTLASLSGASIIATDADPSCLERARTLFHHPRLVFVDPEDISYHREPPDIVLLTDLSRGRPAWERWPWYAWPWTAVLAQLTAHPSAWSELDRAASADVVMPVPLASVMPLLPVGWTALKAECVYGATHVRAHVPGTSKQNEVSPQ